ncbi:uncharacterized protein LOC113794989 [Dermatophagoides pteronyssinus]|uniref:Uncharacterized protein LOC113794989 n=1 Tax=Dermatophagoides pteronyssinus TaxID=6956 RepID=A0A6P6Y7P6_DERPT|nr:uncharacterized protein LOC113794989 [Dermatophagoides pteronyssinus]
MSSKLVIFVICLILYTTMVVIAIPYQSGYGGFGLGGGYRYSRYSHPIYYKSVPTPYYSSYSPKYHPRYYSKLSYYPTYYDHYGYDQKHGNGYGKIYGGLIGGYYR